MIVNQHLQTSSKSIESKLIDFEYTDNGDGTYTITDWLRTYNGEPAWYTLIVPSDVRVII